MKKSLGILMTLCVAGMLFSGCAKENVRDMSEVASRGSFLYCMNNNKDRISDINETLVFNTYEEFCNSSLSDMVMYTTYIPDFDKNVNVKYEYKAKYERYNADYFENNSLLVAFYEIGSDIYDQVIENVTFEENTCQVEIFGYIANRQTLATDEPVSTYACFIETEHELPAGEKATVSVQKCKIQSVGLSPYYDADFNMVKVENDENISAYYIPSLDVLTAYIADNPYLGETVTTTVLKGVCNEEFFEEFALLAIQLPGEYRGQIVQEGNRLTGFRLDSDHYVLTKDAERYRDFSNYTWLELVAVPKDFDEESLTYSFRNYPEWEEGAAVQITQLDEITLVRTDNGGKDYVTYIQQGQ